MSSIYCYIQRSSDLMSISNIEVVHTLLYRNKFARFYCHTDFWYCIMDINLAIVIPRVPLFLTTVILITYILLLVLFEKFKKNLKFSHFSVIIKRWNTLFHHEISN